MDGAADSGSGPGSGSSSGSGARPSSCWEGDCVTRFVFQSMLLQQRQAYEAHIAAENGEESETEDARSFVRRILSGTDCPRRGTRPDDEIARSWPGGKPHSASQASNQAKLRDFDPMVPTAVAREEDELELTTWFDASSPPTPKRRRINNGPQDSSDDATPIEIVHERMTSVQNPGTNVAEHGRHSPRQDRASSAGPIRDDGNQSECVSPVEVSDSGDDQRTALNCPAAMPVSKPERDSAETLPSGIAITATRDDKDSVYQELISKRVQDLHGLWINRIAEACEETDAQSGPLGCSGAFHDLVKKLKMENDPASEVETRILPARRARSIPAGHVLDSAAVCKALKDGLGIEYLYLHQALALELLRTNVDVALSTSTASGKSLVYMVHIMRLLVNEARKKEKERSRILVVFPLKALAQDQLLKIRDAVKELWRGTSKTAKKMVDVAPIQVDVFDGDTDKKDRDRIRKTSSVILTNPDMLHLILAQHSMWAGFLSRLRFVVVDESHIYKGMFGTHFAFVLRRLRHVCATYGLIPNFLLLSGTISNPRAHAERLIGRPVELVSREFDGAPLGKRTFVIWNPALHQRRDGEPMKRKTLPEAASILCYLLEHTNLRGICFVKSRVVGEVLHKLVLETLRSRGPRAEALEGSVQNYRAGYKAEERRKTERMLFANQLRVVIATSALELGIDVGGLDFTVMLGFPGSVSSMWQQVGRSGRRTKPSLAILVATEVTADQYYASEPDMLLEAPAEFATLDLANQNIARNHLLCLIAETTLSNQVANDLFGEHVQNLLVELEQEGLVSALKMSAVHTQWQPVESKHATENSLGRHAFSFGLRSSSRETYTVVERGSEEIIEEVDAARAASVCHKGAVLLHQRESYLIISVDHATRRAVAIKPQVIRYYTEPKLETSVLGLHATAEVWIGGRGSGGLLRFGTVSIAETTTHFYKMKHFVSSGTESWGFDSKLHAVDFPAHQFETKATWLGFPMSLVTEFYARASSDFENAVEGLTHLLHSVIPWVAGCDTSEIKACTVGMSGMTDGAAGLPAEPSVKATATGSRGGVSNLFDRCVLIYDACSGGSGLAHTLFMTSSATLSVARDVLLRCACGPSGCPSCVLPRLSRSAVSPDKRGTQRLLELVLQRARA